LEVDRRAIWLHVKYTEEQTPCSLADEVFLVIAVIVFELAVRLDVDIV